MSKLEDLIGENIFSRKATIEVVATKTKIIWEIIRDTAATINDSYIKALPIPGIFKEHKKEIKNYRKGIEDYLIQEKNYSPKLAKMISKMSPKISGENGQTIFIYTIATFLQGSPKRFLDAFADWSKTDRKEFYKANVSYVTETLRSLEESLSWYGIFKVGKFLSAMIPEYLYWINPIEKTGEYLDSMIPVGEYLKNTSDETIIIGLGVFIVARFGVNAVRRKIFYDTGEYVTSFIRYFSKDLINETMLSLYNSLQNTREKKRREYIKKTFP